MPHQRTGLPYGSPRGAGGGNGSIMRADVVEIQRRRMAAAAAGGGGGPRMMHPSQTSPHSPHSSLGSMHSHALPMSPRFVGSPHHYHHHPHPESPGWYIQQRGAVVAGAASIKRMVPMGGSGGISSLVAATASSESLIDEHRLTAKRQKLTETKINDTDTTTTKEETQISVDTNKRSEEDVARPAEDHHHKHITDDDYSIGTNEADAASALLFATTAIKREQQQKQKEQQQLVAESKKEDCNDEAGKQEDENNEKAQKSSPGVDTTSMKRKNKDGDHDDDNDDVESEDGEKQTKEDTEQDDLSDVQHVPLKKRKMMDYLRKKPSETMHVSPLSNSSIKCHQNEKEEHQVTASGEETSHPRANTTASQTSSTCMAHSYDLKDTQTLHDTAKISDAAEISPPPPSQVIIPHFPSVLHSLLTESDVAGNVVQWLDHGKAWKINRWDALRRKVLPKYFPQLRDEDGKVSGSIDAFLWHLRAWGFHEIKDGHDVGAYSHAVSLVRITK